MYAKITNEEVKNKITEIENLIANLREKTPVQGEE